MSELHRGHEHHPAVERLRRDPDVVTAMDVLIDRLSGADLTAVLLEVAERRAGRVTPANVLKQYESDRFVQPSQVDARELRRTEQLALDAIGSSFETIAIAPVAPLGAHSTIAGVSQNRVISTTRNTEVAADPTNSLALEAASRRRHLLTADPRSSETVHLATTQRVVRAQMMNGPTSFPHFLLLGMVSAGRDVGNRRFEAESFVAHLNALADGCFAMGADRVLIGITDFDGSYGEVTDEIVSRVASERIAVVRNTSREVGRDYYPSLCFDLKAQFCTDPVEAVKVVDVGDGGMVPWTQRLLGSRKERLMISGLGLDRLALMRSSLPSPHVTELQ